MKYFRKTSKKSVKNQRNKMPRKYKKKYTKKYIKGGMMRGEGAEDADLLAALAASTEEAQYQQDLEQAMRDSRARIADERAMDEALRHSIAYDELVGRAHRLRIDPELAAEAAEAAVQAEVGRLSARAEQDPKYAESLEVLGLSRGARAEQIKKAYRRLSLRHHPDKGGDPEEFKKLKAAFDYLKTPRGAGGRRRRRRTARRRRAARRRTH